METFYNKNKKILTFISYFPKIALIPIDHKIFVTKPTYMIFQNPIDFLQS